MQGKDSDGELHMMGGPERPSNHQVGAVLRCRSNHGAKKEAPSASAPQRNEPKAGLAERPYAAQNGLRLQEEKGYRAGGLMVIRGRGTDSQVLLGFDRHRQAITYLGGKRDNGEYSSAETACREFYEETGGLLSKSTKEALLRCSKDQKGGSVVVWVASGKYALYLVLLDSLPEAAQGEITRLPQTYLDRDRTKKGGCMDEMANLYWVDWPNIVTGARQIKVPRGHGTVFIRPHRHPEGKPEPQKLHSFCAVMTKDILSCRTSSMCFQSHRTPDSDGAPPSDGPKRAGHEGGPKRKIDYGPVDPKSYASDCGLREQEARGYKSAGIVIATGPEHGSRALLGFDVSRDAITFIGGKRDPGEECAATTACREFYEETGGILSCSTRDALRDFTTSTKAGCVAVWVGPGKYAMYVVTLGRLPPDVQEELLGCPLAFASRKVGENKTCMDEMSSLHWVEWSSILLGAKRMTGGKSGSVLVRSEEDTSLKPMLKKLHKFAGTIAKDIANTQTALRCFADSVPCCQEGGWDGEVGGAEGVAPGIQNHNAPPKAGKEAGGAEDPNLKPERGAPALNSDL